MNVLFDKIKELLKKIKLIYIVGFLVFIIYLLVKHPVLAGLAVFGFSVAFFCKKNGVFVLSLLADLADYIGGSIPFFGDFLDIFIVIIQAIKYGSRGFVGFLELIPFVDLLPIMVVNAAFAEYKNKKSDANNS